MNNVPFDKVGTLAATKVASLFVPVVLAVALFALPSVAFGFSGSGSTGWGPSQNVSLTGSLQQRVTTTVTLHAAYKIQTDEVSPKDTGHFWPDPQTSFLNKAPIGVEIRANVKAAVDCPAGAIVQIDPPPGTPQPTSDNGDPLMPQDNALCIGKDPATGKNLVLVVLNGKLTRANLADGTTNK